MDFLKSNTLKLAFEVSISHLCLLSDYSFVPFITQVCQSAKSFSVPSTETLRAHCRADIKPHITPRSEETSI